MRYFNFKWECILFSGKKRMEEVFNVQILRSPCLREVARRPYFELDLILLPQPLKVRYFNLCPSQSSVGQKPKLFFFRGLKIQSCLYYLFSKMFKNRSQGWFSHPRNQIEHRFFWPTKGTGGLQHHKFLIFDGKQHPKNIWFRGC